MEAHAPYSLFPIVNCGPDWLTVTSERTGVSNALEDWGNSLLHKEKASAGQVTLARSLGYVGHRAAGLFVGSRPRSVMVQLSGPRCTPLAPEAIALCSNVSRLDLQVTVWTEGEQPHLGAWTYKLMVAQPSRVGHPSRLALTVGHPDGETLNVGRRVSASYGRLYDKTAEAGWGVPRLLWRYEVELKGKAAKQQALRLADKGWRPTHVCRLVHDWYTMKGVRPSFSLPSNEHASQLEFAGENRDVLAWYRDSLSKSIARSCARFGSAAVIEALGLSKLIDGGKSNGAPIGAPPTVEAHR